MTIVAFKGAFMRPPLFAVLLAAAGLFAPPLAARPITDGGITAPEVAQVLQDKGYKAEVGTDSGGDPMVKSATDGSNFTVFFYGCNHGPRCSAIQFHAGFHLDKGMTTEKINEWNRANRFGRGFIDDEHDPNVEMDLDVEHGFLSEGLANNVDTWAAVLPAFKKFIGFE
jgi:hypothetical protein